MINASPMNKIQMHIYEFIFYWSIQPRGQIPDTPPCCRGAIIHTWCSAVKFNILAPCVSQNCSTVLDTPDP